MLTDHDLNYLAQVCNVEGPGLVPATVVSNAERLQQLFHRAASGPLPHVLLIVAAAGEVCSAPDEPTDLVDEPKPEGLDYRTLPLGTAVVVIDEEGEKLGAIKPGGRAGEVQVRINGDPAAFRRVPLDKVRLPQCDKIQLLPAVLETV